MAPSSIPATLPTIPASWTAPTSCFASTNYYRVLLGTEGFFSNMYGTPTPVLTGNAPTGDCFPPSFTIYVPYLTHGNCPSGYTRACATAGPESNGQPLSTVTCCPSVTGGVFSFMCRDNEYGCHATATSGAVWTGVITNIDIPTPTEAPITRTPSTAEGVEAWGIKLISVAAISTTTSTSTSTNTGTGTSTSITTSNTPITSNGVDHETEGLSTGAIVGIVIGSLIAVALLALGAFLLYRKRQGKQNNYAQHLPTYTESPTQKDTYQLNPQNAPYQLDAQNAPHQLDAQDTQQPSQRQVWELHG